MKNEEKVRKWPFLGAAVLFIANVDLVLVPLVLKSSDLSFWSMYWIAMPIANLEIFGWFYFWKWFAWKWLPATEPVKETKELVKSIIELLREHGLLGTIIYKVRETFKWATSPDQKRSLEKWGHFLMLFLGFEPFFVGGRLLGVISCGAARWKAGLVSLCIGNAVHVYVSIKTWNLFFYLLDEYKGWFILLGIITLMFMARGYFWKKLKKNQA